LGEEVLEGPMPVRVRGRILLIAGNVEKKPHAETGKEVLPRRGK